MKQRLLPLTLALVFILSTAIISINSQAKNVSALSGSQFKSGNIISDGVFFNKEAMSASQIQNFLNAKVPKCDTYGSKPYGGTTRKKYAASKGVSTPFICLKNKTQNTPSKSATSYCKAYPGGNYKASRIIYEVGKACGVSQKVLLVLLQKEQSLVTDDWPWPIQYRSATGYGCPDTAPCDSEYYGFFNQVYQAARIYKVYSDINGPNYRKYQNNYIQWHPNAGCGGSTVYIKNQATAGLYNYTPYRPNQAALNNLYGTGNSCSSYGNRNFWRIYNNWFGSTTLSPIINVPGSSTLYLEYNGKKYGIPSQNILRAYGLHNKKVSSVSQSYLNSLNDGGVLSTLFKFEGSGTVRLVDHQKHFGIPSSDTCDAWGLPCFNNDYVKELPSFIKNYISNGGTLKELMWTQKDGYSKMINGEKSQFIGSLVSFGYNSQSATPIDNPANYNKPYTSPLVENNIFVKFGNSGTIYYHYSGDYYTFPSLSTYLAWSKNTSKKTYSDKHSALSSSPPSSSGTFGIFASHGSSKFLINKGKKYYINSVESDWPNTVNHSFALALLSELPSGTITDNKLFRDDSSGAIYQARDKKSNTFITFRDYLAFGGNNLPLINVSSNITNALDTGHSLLGQGALFKKSGTNAIYVLSKDNQTSRVLTSLSQIKRLGLKPGDVLTVDNTTATAYMNNDTFKDFIKKDSKYFALSQDNKRVIFSSGNLSRWGVNTGDSQPFTSFVTRNIPKSNVNPRFIVAPNGTIYYGHGGTKRAIGSYKKYKQLGGHSNNTFDGTAKFISTLPTGSPIN